MLRGNLTREEAGRRLRHSADVLIVLIDRDLKVLYKRASLGIAWAIVNPLLQLLIFTFLFRRVLRLNIDNYQSYVFIGILVWSWFQSSLIQGAGLITGSQALVRQPGFPLHLLPHVTVGVRFFHFLIAFPLLMILLWKQDVRPTPAWCAIPLLMVIQFILITGLVYPIAALNVRIRDTKHVVTVLLQMAMYLTPVFYSIATVPESVRTVYFINPMVPLLEAWRAVLLNGCWPDVTPLFALAVFSCVCLWVGKKIFVAESHRFVEEL